MKPQDDSDKAVREAANMSRLMVCGGLAGMIAKTATNPLERIKILSQTGEHGGKGKQSVTGIFRSIIQNEGILGLWRGNGANLLRVFPAKAVVFSCNDKYKQMMYRLSNTSPESNLPVQLSFLAGGMAGMTATAATYPLDLARGRMSGKIASATKRHYTGIMNTIAVTVREEGFLALYKGVTPTVLGAMPYEGIKFGTVGVLEALFPIEKKYNETTGKMEKQKSVWRKLLFGGTGGVMAGLITYPNDTVRRMLQLQGSKGTAAMYTGYWDCVRKVYAKHGIQRFYHGCWVNIIRMAPNTAVQFGSYELLKQLTEKYV